MKQQAAAVPGGTEVGAPVGPVRRHLAVALLQNRLPRLVAGVVHGAIGLSPAWRSYYSGLCASEGLVRQGVPATDRLAFLEAQVLASVARGRLPRQAFGLLGAAAAGATVAIVALWPQLPAWQERGGGPLGAGLHVRCVVDPQGPAPRVVAESSVAAGSVGPELNCPDTATLVFSTTNLSKSPSFVFVVGVAADNSLRWYTPFTAGGRSVLVMPGDLDSVLEPIAAAPAGGEVDRVTLHVLFTSGPLSGATVRETLEEAWRNGLHLASTARLPVADSEQARIELRRGSSAGR